MIIPHQTLVDANGQPVAVQISWEDFQILSKQFDDESDRPSAEEAEAIAAAERDRKAGNDDAFTDLADLRGELSR